MADVVHITAEEAAAALKAAAFEVTDPDSQEHGRRIVHCFAGGFGADWDLDDCLATLPDAQDITWIDSIVGHDLRVVDATGRTRYFDVKRPAQAEPPAAFTDALSSVHLAGGEL